MKIGCSELFCHFPELTNIQHDMESVIHLLVDTYYQGGKILLCGNGGSASDCLHIAGEFMKGFLLPRPVPESSISKMHQSGMRQDLCSRIQEGVKAIPLTGQDSLCTAVMNDTDASLIFAQQVYVLGNKGDVLLALSTSGNAENVKNAVCTARCRDMSVIGLTGACGGWLGENADISLRMPSSDTYRIQEYHLPVYHAICRDVEEILFGM